MAFTGIPDQELIKQSTEGNDRAFSELFRRYFNKLYQFSLKYVKDETVAESLVLDLLLQVWQKSDQINQQRELAPYLFTAMKNTVFNHIRKKYRETLTLEEIPDQLQLAGSADEELEAKELVIAYHQILEQLSPQRRKIFEMSREQEMSHKDIALQLQLSVSTVNNHISASMSFLRQKMKKHTNIAFALFLFLFR